MQENEFEKQVKNTMEELRLSPSAPVWEAIKKHIEKKKRRAWPFFLLLLPVAMFGGYFLYVDMNKHHKTLHNGYVSNNTIKKEKTQPFVQIKRDSIQNNLLSFNLKIHPSLINNFSKAHQSSIKNFIPQQQISSHLRKDKVAFAYQPVLKTNYDTSVMNTSDYKSNTINIVTLKHINDVTQQKTIDSNPNSNTFKANADLLLNINTNQVTKNINDDSSTKSNDTFQKTDSTKPTQKRSTKKDNELSKWQWGITAMYGKSNLGNNLNINSDKSAQPVTVNSPGGTIRGGTTVSENPYQKASAYNFGIIIQRKIFKKSYVSSGLNFVYLSNKSTTGRNLDSSLVFIAPNAYDLSSSNTYYRAGSEKIYTNTFSFIELPLAFESSLFHVKRFSVSYNAGFSVMQILSSKSLIYNSKNNSFFADSNFIRHTQFQLLGGISLQLSTKHAGDFLLGPHVEYSLSTFLKNNDYNHLHFINYGLQATWLFHKK